MLLVLPLLLSTSLSVVESLELDAVERLRCPFIRRLRPFDDRLLIALAIRFTIVMLVFKMQLHINLYLVMREVCLSDTDIQVESFIYAQFTHLYLSLLQFRIPHLLLLDLRRKRWRVAQCIN